MPSTRPPAVAGTFYPGDPGELRRCVAEHLEKAAIEAAPERVAALVVPHAGFVYSGPCAAYAYARVAGDYVKRVILLGSSHRDHFDAPSIVTGGVFETPVGDFPIDGLLAARLTKGTGAYSSKPHGPEHALEVQLPFISAVIGHVPILPVLFGSSFSEPHRRFSEALAQELEDGDLVLASTDLSHYLTDDEARKQDRNSLDLLMARDVEGFVQGVADGRCAMCGAAAVAVAMAYCAERGAEDWTLLDYRTSADASGDRSRVVGYAAVSMEQGA